MQAGKLRHVIKIQAPETGRNAVGETVTQWVDFAVVPASIEPISSTEQFTAQQFLPEITHKIRIRYMPGISHKYRILYNGRVFEIAPPRNIDERNRELEILAREVPC